MEKYQHLEPTAKAVIDAAAKESYRTGILMMVDGFISDKEAKHLRDMLWYARDNGVEVRFVPSKEQVLENVRKKFREE